MFRNVIFYDNFTDALTSGWKTFMLQGVLLVLLGFLILFMPQLLVAMISATFVFLGALFIALALKTRRLRHDYRTWRQEFWIP